MRAAVITKPGGPEVLQIKEVKDPYVSPGQVRVSVKAAGVNQADLLQRSGLYPAPKDSPADIPGLEFAGVVDQIGEDVFDVKLGDRVFGLVGSGSYADCIVTNSRALASIPENLSFIEAAAMPEAFITAYDAMVSQAKLSSGQWLLINAVGSGVGTAAVQIANVIGAFSIGTARSEDKLKRASELGLNYSVLASQSNWYEQVMNITSGSGVDVVLELVGGNYVSSDLKCMSKGGRLIVVGLLAGASVELDLAMLLHKRLSLCGTVLRSRPLEEKIVVHQMFAKHLVPHIAAGRLKPIIDRVLPLSQVAEAHRYMAASENFGKVILDLG